MAAASFDIGQFWKSLSTMMKFVQGRLEFGQIDCEEKKMHGYIDSSYTSLKASIIVKGTADTSSEHASRVFFWADCKKYFEHVYDIKGKKPKSSIRFDAFYKCLFRLQELALDKPDSFWTSHSKPPKLVFPETPARARSRSPRRQKQQVTGGSAVGKAGIWLWKNPPELLHNGKGFWIFFKHAYWVCDTPEDPTELDRFEVVAKTVGSKGRVDGNFTLWVHEKYASQFPFLHKYDLKKGMNYGLLQRLDRETSGPVLVAKNEVGWAALKETRDNHDWHKEYLCLVHGCLPPSHAHGVVAEWILSENVGAGARSAKSRIVPGPDVIGRGGEKPKQGVTIYEALEYYKGTKPNFYGKLPKYTLVKVRIVTGIRHQIRVHMHHLLSTLGSQIGEGEDFGLVSDFLYLDRSTSMYDQDQVCERVFLHERCLGMWDPEDSNQTEMIYACPEKLPVELEDCLKKLSPDPEANKALKNYLQHLAKKSQLEAFCQQYGVGALEKSQLQDESWDEWRANFIKLFRERAGEELPKMSMPPPRPGMPRDHSFLVNGIIRQMLTARDQDAVEEVLESQITQKVHNQNLQAQLESVKEANENEILPPGWRRMVAPDGSFMYMHQTGQMEKRKPIPDKDLPEGWTKFAREGRVGQFVYYHAKNRTTLFERPTNTELPAGWIEMASKREKGKKYFLHKATGTVQLGMPCAGPPEDLPGEWEKVAKRSEAGAFYYYNRTTGKSRDTRPEAVSADSKQPLPAGWTEETSSKGHKYFFHKASGKSQFERPASDTLPAGWTTMTSSKGHTYYFHKASGKTQFERPNA